MQEVAAEATAEASEACPRCGLPAAEGQLVCLECGAPIALQYRRPPDWRIGAAVLALVAVTAAVVFGVALSQLGDDAKQTVNRPAVEPPPAEPNSTSNGIPRWPDGLRAYTVILRATRRRPVAERLARRALRQGLEAGIARSDGFSTLQPGRWIAFAGRFQSLSEAEAASETYAARNFSGGEPRLLQPAR